MPRCVSVDKNLAERAIKELNSMYLIDSDYSITRIDNKVIIPVKVNIDKIMLSFGEILVFECTPPTKKRRVSINIPSHDFLGEVVILRRNVLENRDPDELINSIKQVYPRVKAIWVKDETVDTYRKPVLRLLWGEEVKDIVVKEYGLTFRVKLGEVYYNPRLAEEHHRIANSIKPGEVIVDAFSGIGGFTLHIAFRAPCLIIANDINPVAYELLVENILLNRRRLKGSIIPLNNDVMELPSILRLGIAERVLANLPLESLKFSSIYDELMKPGGILHLYMLSSSIYDAKETILEVFESWILRECRLVLEYAPYMGIFRCDLVKP